MPRVVGGALSIFLSPNKQLPSRHSSIFKIPPVVVSCTRCRRHYHLLDKLCGDSLYCPSARQRLSQPGNSRRHRRDLSFPTANIYRLAFQSIRSPHNASMPGAFQILPSAELPRSLPETLSRALACVSSSVVINPPLTLLRSHSQ
jgi:hypothetical protein